MGRSGVARPDRTVDALGALDADVVALQEVDASQPHEGNDRLLWMARQLGMEAIAGPARSHGVGYFGNALLTRLPIERVEHLDISVSGREPRAVLHVMLHGPDTPLHVLVTHFGLGARERQRQATALLALIRQYPQLPAVVAGDFNEWAPRSRTIARLDRELGPTPARRTFPARWPLLRLDRIWVRPRNALRSLEAIDARAVREASDHLPLCATIAFGEGGSDPRRHGHGPGPLDSAAQTE